MRVLAVNQFYPPDHAATGQLLGELCADLAAGGDEVTVVASSGTYLGGQKLPGRDLLDGVHVIRPWATSFGKASRRGRLSDYLSFWATALGRAARVARPDVILALTTPPMIAAGVVALGVARRIPVTTWVQDVYPEVAAAFGVLDERGAPYRALLRTAAATHGATCRVVALSDGMAERLVAQGAPRSRIRVIQNWADGNLIFPVEHGENPFRQAHLSGDSFLAMYSGNLGVGHDMATLIDAARLLRERDPRVQLVFVGEGARKAEAERRAQGLGNVRFLPYQRKSDLRFSLAAADVHLVSLNEGLQGLLVPSKVYGALASGRPICYVGPASCEVARVVESHGVGLAVRNGDSEGLASALSRLANDRGLWAAMCLKARSIFLERFDRPVAVAQFRQVLSEAAQSQPTRVGSAVRMFRAAFAPKPRTIAEGHVDA
ncbi:MAG: glycosyltransferase family 4 protein [Polyangiaceae bacterium]|nr:glycosyltransferase family 4 protein [Polyangiaceae bacterium]